VANLGVQAGPRSRRAAGQELTGLVGDCCCEASSVESLNAQLRGPLMELLKSTFFSHFHVRGRDTSPCWSVFIAPRSCRSHCAAAPWSNRSTCIKAAHSGR